MPLRKTRPFGQIPEWAKLGMVTLRNYDLRAEAMMARMDEPIPYIRLPHLIAEDEDITGELWPWLEYWIRHLGGLPRQPRMLIEGFIEALNVPTAHPEQFDPRFQCIAIWQRPNLDTYRARLPRSPDERLAGCFANLFVPTFAPQYAQCVERAKTAPISEWYFGYSHEDPTREGIWVSLAWIRPDMAALSAFPKPSGDRTGGETPQTVIQRLGITQTQWDAIPDAPQRPDYWTGTRWPT